MALRLEVVLGDITREHVDVVVNAANPRLAGGGGVDGAIHRAAGWAELRAACAALGGCAVGDAKLTPGFRLPARYIAHAVGPVYRDGRHGEPELLASCYRRCLQLADEVGATSIAFPAISTGAYGYPPDAAAAVAVQTLRTTPTAVRLARLVAFDDEARRVLEAAVRLSGAPG
ncbi:MAG TPA: O-acetyl-ADP-ribose deacetylase [Acidimicrobiales bacterium]|nr:O-acetyl-ADP-ribose deacetylase [Acidimicrobiales bacterium]